MLKLDTNITDLRGVGKTIAGRLKRLGIETVEDLLFYFPCRYEDYTSVASISGLIPGQSANIVGKIELIQNRKSPRKRMFITEALIKDKTETIKIIWFNQPFIAKNLRAGDLVSLAGKVEGGINEPVMKSPAYEKIYNQSGIHTQGLVPVYHLTANITQKQLRYLIKQSIPATRQIEDWLPREIINSSKLLALRDAVNKIHFPKNRDDAERARRRLAFNELFILQLKNRLAREKFNATKAKPVPFQEDKTRRFVNSLPFKLTDAQRQAAWEILKDLAEPKPMARLLEGDVGSGKTVVAVIAMLNASLNKMQSAIMVPTEILASQHFYSISQLLKNTDIKICLFTRGAKKINFKKQKNEKTAAESGPAKKPEVSISEVSKKDITAIISSGKADIIIGTHALIQENINFNNLALAIIDEQHRFGVEQRQKLIEKAQDELKAAPPLASGGAAFNSAPHLLSMTATPIPRSLALALYGDLDISIINEMPPGRKQIITRVVPESKREKAYRFIQEQVNAGRQIYVICPLIDISDKLGVKSVKAEYEKLNNKIFPDLSLAMLHGRLKADDKEKIMRDFIDNKINILVSTSVIEVGVDVPNACVMMIEGAERFGLAQLHQFRGRVGRSGHQSYCFLFTDSQAERTLKRLETMVAYSDGFKLARMDLKFRGPGEVYGLRQKGFPELKIASLFDYELMKLAREQADELIAKDNSLTFWPKLKEKVNKTANTQYLIS